MASNSFPSFKEALHTIEAYYRQLMQGDLTPEEEAEIRVMLLGLFSTLKAHSSRMENTQTFITNLMDVRETLIAWNALGPWFKEVKPLVCGVFSLITLGKELLLSATPQPVVKGDEIEALRVELREVKDTVKSLIHALKASTRTIDPPVEVGPSTTEPSLELATEREEAGEVSPINELNASFLQPPSDLVEADALEKSAEDSFMELTSLEAKKYAVEKAIATLESEFYENRVPKNAFEKSLATHKRELTQILNRISVLRDELKAPS